MYVVAAAVYPAVRHRWWIFAFCFCVWEGQRCGVLSRLRTRRKYKSVCLRCTADRYCLDGIYTHAPTSHHMSHAFKERKKLCFLDWMSRFLKQRRHEWDYEGVFLMQHLRNRTLKYKSLSWRIQWDVKENSFVIFLSPGCFHAAFLSSQRTDGCTKSPVMLHSIRSEA